MKTPPFPLPHEYPGGITAWMPKYLPWTTGAPDFFRRIAGATHWDKHASQDLWQGWWKLAILMADPTLNEIQVQPLTNDPTRCSVISQGPLGMQVHPDLEMTPREILDGLRKIASARRKGIRGFRDTENEADTEVILTTELDDGPRTSRLTAVVPPASSAPALSIRRFPIGRIPEGVITGREPLDRMVHENAWPGEPVPVLNDPLPRLLAEAALEDTHVPWASIPYKPLAWIRQTFDSGKNALVFGPTGSGKTTVLQTLIGMCNPNERIVSVEVDASELDLPHFNQVRLQATSPEKDAQRTPDKALGAILRLTPDVIAFGELRGGEGYAYVQAVSSGHRGLTTIHASSPRKAIRRMVSMVQTGAPAGTAGATVEGDVMDSSNILIHVARQHHVDGDRIRVVRRVEAIHELIYSDTGIGTYRQIFRTELNADGAPCLVWTGDPGSLADYLEENHKPLPAWMVHDPAETDDRLGLPGSPH